MTNKRTQQPNDDTIEGLAECLEFLEQLCQSPELCLGPHSPYRTIADKAALLGRRLKAAKRKEGRERDREVATDAAIRKQRQAKTYGRFLTSDTNDESLTGPVDEAVEFERPHKCYVCKNPYRHVHSFYDAMCSACGDENWRRRQQSSDLSGRTIVITGGRIKIGFQAGLKCLRAGASVLVTSRFPHDTMLRYAGERDYSDWATRLTVYSADFRSLSLVEAMCHSIAQEHGALDGIINNAAQTVRRPPEYYRDLVAREQALVNSLGQSQRSRIVLSDMADPRGAEEVALRNERDAARVANEPRASLPLSAAMTQIAFLGDESQHAEEYFPAGVMDRDGQQVDARSANSWIKPLCDVTSTELIEVHAVNALVPFILIQRLEPLLLASPNQDRYIVNVSAMEGQFQASSKAPRHPHTNMAKASLNMLTRTCADEYAKKGIYMNSVDTGWVTNEFPLPKVSRMQTDGFEPPLDEIDGASRVCDPIFRGVGDRMYIYGKFLKDYREIAW